MDLKLKGGRLHTRSKSAIKGICRMKGKNVILKSRSANISTTRLKPRCDVEQEMPCPSARRNEFVKVTYIDPQAAIPVGALSKKPDAMEYIKFMLRQPKKIFKV